MMHNEAFHQIILENPVDDAPRLIYADWLEEHGDPRGEFIRLQCELAKLPKEHPTRAELHDREAQLLADHQDEWVASLRPWVTSWRFQRGFVEQVTVPVQVCLDPTACLRLLAPIREIKVDLTGAVICQRIVELVPESLARERRCFPIGRRNGQLLVAVPDPDDNDCWQALAFILNTDIGLIRASTAQIVEAIDRHYGQTEQCFVDTCCFVDYGPPVFVERGIFQGEAEDNDSPLAKLVNLIIQEAIALRADEIRIEPEEERLLVYYDMDGVLVERDSPPHRLRHLIAARFRNMAAMENDTGKMLWLVNWQNYELTVRIQPTPHGPRVTVAIVQLSTDI